MALGDPFNIDTEDQTAQEQEEPLVFERDFAPLKKQFFEQVYNDPNLSENTKFRIASTYSNAIDDAYKQRSALTALDQEARGRNLNYKMALFNLNKAREDAARERSQMAPLGGLAKELDVIQSMKDDPEAQAEAYTKLVVRNAPLIASNRGAAVAVGAMQNSLMKPKGYTVLEAAKEQLPFDELMKESQRLGKTVNPDNPNDTFSPLAVSRVRQSQLNQQLAAKRDYEQQNRLYEQQTKVFDKVFGVLDNVKFQEEQRFDPTTKKSYVPDEFKTQADRVGVQNIIDRFGTPEEKSAIKKPDIKASELYSMAKNIQSRAYSDILTGYRFAGQQKEEPSTATKISGLYD